VNYQKKVFVFDTVLGISMSSIIRVLQFMGVCLVRCFRVLSNIDKVQGRSLLKCIFEFQQWYGAVKHLSQFMYCTGTVLSLNLEQQKNNTVKQVFQNAALCDTASTKKVL